MDEYLLTRQLTRRNLGQLSFAALLVVYAKAHALSLSDVSNADAAKGIKTMLEKGAVAAVLQLGQVDGFWGNEKVRIALPGFLQDAGELLSKLGQRRKVEELVLSMNRAAEAAVPLAKTLLVNSVRSMSVVDAKNILTGGDTAVTDFFAGKTREPLAAQFLPMVTNATAKVGLAQKYNRFAGKASRLGLVREADANIQNYVTTKTLDGLYSVIGEQERALRADPAKASTELLRKVLGVLR